VVDVAEFDMGKKVGPLPMGAWIVVIAGGLFVGYMINKSMAKSASEATESQYAESGVGEGGSQLIPAPPAFAPSEEVPEETNALWGRKATNWLNSIGFDGIQADEAVRRYLAGLPLIAQQKTMINQAIAHFGVPPEPLPPTEEPPPTQTPPPGTPAVKPPPVTALRATARRRGVTVTWSFPTNVPIGGFELTVKELKSGKTKLHRIAARQRSFSYTAPRAWNKRTRSKVQFYIKPHKGGFTAKKTYGDGRSVSATPII
jgi:hypothetical protein